MASVPAVRPCGWNIKNQTSILTCRAYKFTTKTEFKLPLRDFGEGLQIQPPVVIMASVHLREEGVGGNSTYFVPRLN